MNTSLEIERTTHNELYGNLAGERLTEPLTWESFYRTVCVPPHEGGPIYGLDQRIFFDMIQTILAETDRSVSVLDYGCGMGELGVLVAQKGFIVHGFDLSERAVEVASAVAANSNASNSTHFISANAQQLPYEDEQFDLVFGKAVLHHVIKYPGTGTELYRIMKPGGRAYFLEGAAGNPLIRLARYFTIKEELGDVALTPRNLRNWCREFSELSIEGYFFLYMLKRFGYRGYDDALVERTQNRFGHTRFFKTVMRACLMIDDWFVNRKAYSRYLGGRYVVELIK